MYELELTSTDNVTTTLTFVDYQGFASAYWDAMASGKIKLVNVPSRIENF